jgi:superfamily II DNA or RNA helicase
MTPQIPAKRTRIFGILLNQHRLWGTILTPYIITTEPGKSYNSLAESLSPFQSTESLGALAPEEREIVNIINEYNDRNLFKLFSKDKSVKDFLANVTTERIETFIRPFIERRVYKCLKSARDENIRIYYHKNRSDTVHEEDRLFPEEENAQPVFRFDRNTDQTTYNLSLESNGRLIDLKGNSVDILCMSPCVIREDRTIYFVSEVDGPKLKPFMTKEFISIPKKTEVKYFGSFVLNAVNNYKVEGSGFEIAVFTPDRKACLQLEIGIRGLPVLILSFDYQGNRIYSHEKQLSFTIFEHAQGKFLFRKYHRDPLWEKGCSSRLEELGFFSDDSINFFSTTREAREGSEIYDMIEAVNLCYQEITEAGFSLTSKLSVKYNFRPVTLEISSQLINDWFDLKAIVHIGQWEIPFARLRKNILHGIREYELPDGSIAILPEAWFSRYKNIFELGKSNDDILRLHKQHFSLLGEALSDQGKPISVKLENLLVPEHLPSVDKPEGLNCNMRLYQAEGLNWLSFLQNAGLGGCLADDMGLGKTIQTLALLQHNQETLSPPAAGMAEGQLDLFSTPRGRLTSMIIVPASLVYNWENEIRKFVPRLKAYCHQGTQRKKSASWMNNFDIILSSYHTVRQDIDFFSTILFHYIILDESQMIKNPGSALYKTMIRLKSEFKLVLTGTPVENSLTDLWSQLNFVNPGLLGDLSFFRREFARPIEKSGDDRQEDKLKKIIKPFILRRTKEMVAKDLPPLTEQVVYCDMTDEQMKLYEEEKSAVRNSIFRSIETTGLEKSAIVVLQGLMKLRQISNHPVMTYEDYAAGSGKFETVLQDIESVISEGHKILVFSSFVKHLSLYATELTNQGIKYSLLTGASINREKIVNDFQNDPDDKIFLISLKAGGVGLNLTAADYVFILDPWWNPAAEMQAMNRAHRIGQDKSVFMYKYITTNSIEEKITRLQERKSKLADTFISSNNPLKEIDINEILDIIG